MVSGQPGWFPSLTQYFKKTLLTWFKSHIYIFTYNLCYSCRNAHSTLSHENYNMACKRNKMPNGKLCTYFSTLHQQSKNKQYNNHLCPQSVSVQEDTLLGLGQDIADESFLSQVLARSGTNSTCNHRSELSIKIKWQLGTLSLFSRRCVDEQ